MRTISRVRAGRNAVRTAVLLAIALVLAGTPRVTASPPPKTGFETSGGELWTTLAEEAQFLADVEALSTRTAVSTIATTTGGRDVRLVRVGSATPTTRILVVCSQHGDEPAPREACLQSIRRLALTSNPVVSTQLSSTAVLVVSTANPDGVATSTRSESSGIDVNRDHLTLASVEAKAIAQVLTDHSPQVVIDLHEFYGLSPTGQTQFGGWAPLVYDDDALLLWPRNHNVDPRIYELSKVLTVHLTDTLVAAGYFVDEYGQYSIDEHNVRQIAGDGDEGILRNSGGLRNALTVLMETSQVPNVRRDPRESASVAVLQKRRVATHAIAIGAVLDFARSSGIDLADEYGDARARASVDGASQATPVYFDGADNRPPTQVVDPPPCGYSMKMAEATALSDLLAALDVETQTRVGDVYAPMGQGARALVPLVLDARGLRSSGAAVPLMSGCP